MKTAPTILITGCSSGIGRCCAEGLRARGWRVFATARGEADVAALRGAGFESFRLDLADSDSILAAVDSVLAATGGRLDALFNNAAYGQPGAVEDIRREVLREQFETNLFGTHELTCRVLKVMRKQGQGRIIFNSSLLGLVALRYRGAYNASKFALEGLVDTLRLELSGTGIHVTLIEPGPIASRFRQNAYAAYRRNVDPLASPHREYYAAVERRLTRQGPAAPFTLPPDAVFDKLLRALQARSPRARYYVTFPTHLFGWLRRLLPQPLLDRVLRAVE